MSKLAWVLLPLAVAALAVTVLACSRRLPSRAVLNIGFSLLLLAYLLTTAGLGLFWVANQQLPAFDWHYLFGYAVLGLLAVHLAFNVRVVWQVLRRGRLGAASARPPHAAGRRPVIGLLGAWGAAAAAGMGYFVGLRHGRTEWRLDAALASAGAARAVVEEFHAFSAHSRIGVLRRAPRVDWGDAPAPFKTYPGQPRLALPRRAAAADGRGVDAAALGTLLWHTAGVSARRGAIALRTAPSSGALFATELYVLARAVDGVGAGLWHHDARGHALEALRAGEVDPASIGLGAMPPGAVAAVIATAVFRRSGYKYGDRTYRYVLADLGHALENLRVAGAAVAAPATLLATFDEGPIAEALGLDEHEEGVLGAAWLSGPGTVAAPAVRRAESLPRADGAEAGLARRGGADADAGPLGVTDAIHRASSLRTPALAASAAAEAPAGARQPLPPAESAAGDRLAVIARRRSVRRYAAAPLPLADVSAVLAAMTAVPALLSGAVRIDLLAQAVHGLEPAAWRYEPKGHGLALRVRHGAGLRAKSRAAALDQDVIGDAAAVFVLSIARGSFVADPAGPARGYRHAFIEAGMIGERVYLEGVARGLGVCAVGAFYDDEAAALVGVDPNEAWVVHLVALGIPA
jgi:SagB-type dehydrogenase family enzyme